MQAVGYLSDSRETQPVEAIVIHRLHDRFVGVHHPINDGPDGGAPELGAGELLTQEGVRDLSLRLSGSAHTRQVFPARLLVADSDLIAWWMPMGRRPILFQTQDKKFDEEMHGRHVLHPPLLFVGRPRGLAAYALPVNDRPDGDTPLLRAPYYNLYATGTMCEGDVPLPPQPRPSADCLAAYERGFFDSSFAHTNLGQGDLVRWPGGHAGFWRAMAATTHRCFPFSALVPLRADGQLLTLEKAVNTPVGRLKLDV